MYYNKLIEMKMAHYDWFPVCKYLYTQARSRFTLLFVQLQNVGLWTGLWAHSFLICEMKETSKLYYHLVFLPGL